MLRCDDPSRHLEGALELDPTCELARMTLVDRILGHVDMSQHELPAFYIDDPREDLKALDKAQGFADGGADGAWIDAAKQRITELRALATEWLAWHPEKRDFAVTNPRKRVKDQSHQRSKT